jgi:putative transposase
MDRILGSHTRYFNIANDRKGPLWEGKFKNVMVDKDEYLYHLTRYIHLNPVTAHLVEKPEDWIATSYNEYISKDKKGICSFEDVLDITPNLYRDFVEERIEFQRNLAKIKRFMMD